MVNRMAGSPTKILILMSATGGGHLATARALKSTIEQLYGARFQVDIVDLLVDHMPWPFKSFPESYRFTMNNAPWLHGFAYEAGMRSTTSKSLLRASYEIVRKPVSEALEHYCPDLIISVHPLLQTVPLRVLRVRGYTAPFVTVVTDLVSVHPVWFDPRVALCFVPSEDVRKLALRAGLQADQVRVSGLALRPEFAEPPRPKDVLRHELGIAPDLPAVLLVSGAEGTGPLDEIAETLAYRLSGAGPNTALLGQIVVVCGHNQRLLARLEGRHWPVPLCVTGFVDNMWDWMAACDCIVTKAGPGTIAEALTRGLPILLSGYVPGQEEGNVDYVLENRVGAFIEKPAGISDTVAGWFGSERHVLEEMSEKACQIARPGASFEIIHATVSLLETA